MEQLSDKLYGNLIKLLKIISIVVPIILLVVCLVEAIIMFSSGVATGIVMGIIYLILAPIMAFISGLGIYAVARHFENQDKMINKLNNIDDNTRN